MLTPLERDLQDTVNIFIDADPNAQTVESVLEYYNGSNLWQVSVNYLNDSDVCRNDKFAQAVNMGVNSTLLVLVSEQPYGKTKNEFIMVLDMLTAAVMYNSQPLPDETQFIDEPPPERTVGILKKNRREERHQYKVIAIPIGWMIVIACVSCVVFVLIVGALIGQQVSQRRRLQKLKNKCEALKRRNAGASVREVEAEPLLEHSEEQSSESAQQLSGDVRSKTAMKDTQFTRYMRLVAHFLLDESKRKYPSEIACSIASFLQKQSAWNEEAHDLNDLLNDLRNFVLPSIATSKRIRQHAALIGIPSLADVVAETFCNSLEAKHLIWEGCPLLNELEVVVVNWLGQAIGLPESFLFRESTSNNTGGGLILGSPTESVLVAMIAARHRSLAKDPTKITKELVAYASAEACFTFENAAYLAEVSAHMVTCDQNFRMDTGAFERAMAEDIAYGLEPFYVHVTIGTPSTGAWDDLKAIAAIASRHDMWVHVDAGYTCLALICDEHKHLINGIEQATSISVNTHFTSAPTPLTVFLWTRHHSTVKDTSQVVTRIVTNTSGVASSYRRNPSSSAFYKPLAKFIQMRIYGVDGLRCRVRKVATITARMRATLAKNTRIEIIGDSPLPIIAFRLKGHDSQRPSRTRRFCAFVNASGEMFVAYAAAGDVDVIRLTITYENAIPKYVDESCQLLAVLLGKFEEKESKGERMSESECERYTNDVRMYGEQIPIHDPARCSDVALDPSRTGDGTSNSQSQRNTIQTK